ncbi:hypothetical protein [Methyloversatilis thermotolerans]|uniref:hypothetical protein n=1 Tax=Methyloversatilis thermotolerans TaxID=1346290 RepID=UPI00036B5BDC|nr:hypothetical protein [Methyloversatilis thermotolerans]
MRRIVSLFRVPSFAILLLGCLLVAPLQAQVKLDIIPLKHRTPDQILPALGPLVGKDAALSGANNQIFIRADASTRAAVKQAIAALDTPLRSLMISVRHDNDDSLGREGAAVSGQVRSEGDSRVQTRVWSTRGDAQDRLSQRVQVVEGGTAFIQVGTSTPIPFAQVLVGPGGAAITQGTQYRDVSSGFYAIPHVNGDQVTLDITPQKESMSDTQYGEVRTARLVSTLRGRLGQWMELGGSGYDEQVTQRGVTRYSTRDAQSQRRVWVKVDVVP